MVDLVKPSSLQPAPTVFDDDAMVVDAAGVVRKATPVQVVNAGAPVATQAEAIAGTNNTKRMTPLTVKQVLDNVTAPSVARAQAWAESPTSPDPAIPDSRSSKSWAEDAEAARDETVNAAPFAVKDAADFFSRTELVKGARYWSKDGLAWDILTSGTGDFVVAGAQVKVVASNNTGSTSYSTWAHPSSMTLDNTALLNQAILSQRHTVIPAGDWRIDGTVLVSAGKVLEFASGARLTKLSGVTVNTDAILQQCGNYSEIINADLLQTTDSPNGIYRIGARHEDDISQDNLWWKSLYPKVVGANIAGSKGLVLDSSQWKAGGKANYFGHIMRPILQQTDDLLWIREICNSHTIIDPQFYRPRSYALRLEGAYDNKVFGGFVHTAAPGATALFGIGLLQRTRGANHHSIDNQIIGMGIEPGLTTSRALNIEADCRRNKVLVSASVAGVGFSPAGLQNTVDTNFGTVQWGRPTIFEDTVSLTGSRLLVGRDIIAKRARQTGLGENVTVDLFKITVGTGSDAVLNVRLRGRTGALGRGTAIDLKYRLSRNLSGDPAVVGTPVGLNDGNGGTLSVAVNPSSTSEVIVRWTTANNGTATMNATVTAEAILTPQDDAPAAGSANLTVL